MNLVETYLEELRRAIAAGVAETSSYPALANLLNAVGGELAPKVRCVIHPRASGAGLPDGGLFTAGQLPRTFTGDALADLLPERGAVEAKGLREDVADVAGREQTRRYLARYGQVLVTSYREFLLLTRDEAGVPRVGERFTLADSPEALWSASPRALAAERGPALVEYLKRVMLTPAPLTSPADVAQALAAYAREARLRVDRATLPALANLRAALEQALGITFTDERGEHFFRATLVQTLFYGVFSAWVLWRRSPAGRRPDARFDWRLAAWSLHVPMIRTLFEQIASPSQLGPLGLVEVLEWTADALNRVDEGEFFRRFEAEHAVQYFYEPFLEAYDPDLRRELGVWYTPPEIVQYMVARVDTVLREELHLPDGLADPNVYVLDPCCGTGAYLVEVLRRIAQTKHDQGESAFAGHEAKQAAMTRVFGFELLPAPFVVAHLQLGMLLQSLHAGLDDQQGERVGVYLTNALTGWEPAEEPKQQILFPEFNAERDAAAAIKQSKPILVVLGNPPYNAFAGVSPAEEGALVEAYKEGLVSEWGITRNYLDDLYVRFFRIAERRIAEQSHQGVVCLISSFSYLSDPSYVCMRQRFLGEFDRIWIDCLNGDSRLTGKRTPDGQPDPSVFSTERNREGIRVGTAVALMVRSAERNNPTLLRFRSLWGARKRQSLLDSVTDCEAAPGYEAVVTGPSRRYSFRPAEIAEAYVAWPKLPDMSAEAPMLGLNENRGGSLQDIDRAALHGRMTSYFDPNLDWEGYAKLGHTMVKAKARYSPRDVRAKAIAAERFNEGRLMRYTVRPLDVRWAYYTPVRPVWNECRPTLRANITGCRCLLSRPTATSDPEGAPVFAARTLGEMDLMRGHAYYMPVLLGRGSSNVTPDQLTLFGAGQESGAANLSPTARAYLASLGIPNPDADEETAGLVWMHALAIGYSQAYLTEHADGIRQDWPRIPLPAAAETLRASAALGRRLADLLDPETPVAGVTTGSVRPELRSVARLERLDGSPPDLDRELGVTAGWGHGGKGGVTMPGKGRTLDGAPHAALGPTLDVCLNDTVCWRGVPESVWSYTIGGYQVLKKWLSYRERPLLGRDLKPDEAREVTHIARRLAAIVLLADELDANYRATVADTYAWPHRESHRP